MLFLSLFTLTQVSTVYNKAIATSNTEIIVNSVIVLFVMDLDEWIFVTLKACNEKWTAHASDSEDTSSDVDVDARNGSSFVVAEMKKEIALQKTQIADQKKEIMLQKEQMARQNGEIAMLRETVEKLLESHAVVSTSSDIIPQCTTNTNKSLTTRARPYGTESEDTCSDSDAVAGEGETKDKNLHQKDHVITIGMPRYVEQEEEESGVGTEAAASDVEADSEYEGDTRV